MALKQLDATTFKSTAGAPGGVTMIKDGVERPRAFGGHVYAQAIYAASKTVDPIFVIHVSTTRAQPTTSRRHCLTNGSEDKRVSRATFAN